MTPDELARLNELTSAETLNPDEQAEKDMLQNKFDIASGNVPAPEQSAPEVPQVDETQPVEPTPQDVPPTDWQPEQPQPQDLPIGETPTYPEPEPVVEVPENPAETQPVEPTPEPVNVDVSVEQEVENLHPFVAHHKTITRMLDELDSFLSGVPEMADRSASVVRTRLEEAQLWLEKSMKEHGIDF